MDIPIGKEIWLSFKGDVHFTNYYKMLYDWLINNGFRHRPVGTDESDAGIEIEDYYSEIRMPGFSNHWVWWRLQQQQPNGDDLFDFHLDVVFQTLGLKQKEILVNGNKFKVNSGEVNVKIYAKVVFHKDKLTDNWLGKTLFDYLRWKHYQSLIDEHKADMYDMTMEFYDRAKQGLGLDTFVTNLQDPFHPKLG
ncbi:MAG: hypothetical protein ACMXYA_02720, partial [Candidatus Woesearchaeota archaeon]